MSVAELMRLPKPARRIEVYTDASRRRISPLGEKAVIVTQWYADVGSASPELSFSSNRGPVGPHKRPYRMPAAKFVSVLICQARHI